MSTSTKTIVVSLVLFVSAMPVFAQDKTNDFPVLKGPYLGQKPPGLTAEIFAPGIICKENSQEFAGTFSPDGKEFFFTRRSELNSGENTRIWHTFRNEHGWSKPQLAPFAYNCFEFEPCISPDGKKLFYGSARPKPSGKTWKGDIWFVEKSDSGWGEPQFMGSPINDEFAMYISVTRGGIIYLTGPGGIYRSLYKNGIYLKPEKLSDSINYLAAAAHPYIAPDESFLIFDSQDQNYGFGGTDIYISFRNNDGSWTKAVNMGEKINSSINDIAASVSPDGKYMFFESSKTGSMNIYWVDAKIIEKSRPGR